jgi:hypothetical protein
MTHVIPVWCRTRLAHRPMRQPQKPAIEDAPLADISFLHGPARQAMGSPPMVTLKRFVI